MRLRILQLLVLGLLVVAWYVLTAPGLIPPFYLEQDNRPAFFFGEPQKVFWVVVEGFATGEIFIHLAVTLLETALGFAIGSALGPGIGRRLGPPPPESGGLGTDAQAFNSTTR